jgi:predicted RecB family nuclease
MLEICIGGVYRAQEETRMRQKTSAERAPSSGLLAGLSAPARRALEREGITTVARLAQHSEAEILALHGIGPSAIPRLRSSLAAAGVKFKK